MEGWTLEETLPNNIIKTSKQRRILECLISGRCPTVKKLCKKAGCSRSYYYKFKGRLEKEGYKVVRDAGYLKLIPPVDEKGLGLSSGLDINSLLRGVSWEKWLGLHNLVFEFKISSEAVDALCEAYLRPEHWRLKNAGAKQILLYEGSSGRIMWLPKQYRLVYKVRVDRGRWAYFEIYLGGRSKGKIMCKLSCSDNTIRVVDGDRPAVCDLIKTMFMVEQLFRYMLEARGVVDFYIPDFTKWFLIRCEVNRDGRIREKLRIDLPFEVFVDEFLIRVYEKRCGIVRAEAGGNLNLSFDEIIFRILSNSSPICKEAKHDFSKLKETRDREAQCFSRVDLRLEEESQPVMVCVFLPFRPMICEMEDGRSIPVYPPGRVLQVKEVIITNTRFDSIWRAGQIMKSIDEAIRKKTGIRIKRYPTASSRSSAPRPRKTNSCWSLSKALLV